MATQLISAAVVADPYHYFNELRATDPVHWDPGLEAWLLTRHADVIAAFRDPRLSADRITPYYRPKLARASAAQRAVLEPAYENLSRWMVFLDPPDHTRLRALVSKAFTPRVIESLTPSIVATVNELLDAVPAPPAELELIRDLAYPLPVIVVGEMFGVPRGDRDRIKAWSDEIMLVVMGALDVRDRHERARAAFVEFSDYLRVLISARRRAPREDLLSLLIAAEERGDALSEQEIIATCLMLIFAGHETTTNLLANGVLALLQHPDALAAVRREPARWPLVVEELLRYDGPVKAMWRIAASDLELGGRSIHAGQRVLLVLAGANRDPERFTEPDRLDLARSKDASSHVGFGHGVHYCLGGPLARLETQIALAALFERFPDLRLAGAAAELSWQPTILTRALVELPLLT